MKKYIEIYGKSFIELTNKQAQHFINEYRYSNDRYLIDVYKTYSYAKEKAYDYCIDLFNKLLGYDYRIISSNCNVFTVAFKTKDSKNEYLIVITAYNNYAIPIELHN